MNKIKIKFVFSLLIIFFLYSCSSSFNSIALKQDEEAKEKVLSLINKANERYSKHETEIQKLSSELNRYKAYESGRSNNDETIKMWRKMMDPNNNLYQGFINRWKAKDSLNIIVIEEFKPIISDAFDQIIELEKAKK